MLFVSLFSERVLSHSIETLRDRCHPKSFSHLNLLSRCHVQGELVLNNFFYRSHRYIENLCLFIKVVLVFFFSKSLEPSLKKSSIVF